MRINLDSKLIQGQLGKFKKKKRFKLGSDFKLNHIFLKRWFSNHKPITYEVINVKDKPNNVMWLRMKWYIYTLLMLLQSHIFLFMHFLLMIFLLMVYNLIWNNYFFESVGFILKVLKVKDLFPNQSNYMCKLLLFN